MPSSIRCAANLLPPHQLHSKYVTNISSKILAIKPLRVYLFVKTNGGKERTKATVEQGPAGRWGVRPWKKGGNEALPGADSGPKGVTGTLPPALSGSRAREGRKPHLVQFCKRNSS